MRKLVVIGTLLLLLLALPAATFAAPLFDTVVTDGETINNDIVVASGDVEVEEGGVVNGSITVFSGDAYIAGTVRGDVVLFSGDLEVTDTAVIRGECVVFSGEVTDDTESGVSCTNIQGFEVPNFVPPIINPPEPPNPPEIGDFAVQVNRPSPIARAFGNLAATIGQSLVFALLAFGIASFLPTQLNRVEDTIRSKPVASGAIGSLTTVGLPALLFILSLISALLILACGLGLLGFPVVIGLVLAFVGAAIFGWVVVGTMFGQQMVTRLNMNKSLSLPMVAAMGTAVMTFAIGLLGVLPLQFLEGILSIVIMAVGLGAVALTQFGTKPYPQMAAAAAPTINTDKETAVLDTLPAEDE